MFEILKRFIYTISNKIWFRDDKRETKLAIDFTKSKSSSAKNHPFNIKSDSSYNAYLSWYAEEYEGNDALVLGLKKTNCIAYIDMPEKEYQDHIIEAKIRLDSMGGYAAAGIIFHIMDEESYYIALVSCKGYFRFDSVKDGSPRSLIGWTEISGFDGENFNLKIISYGSYLIFIVNEKWAAEISDDSNPYGTLGLALASYPSAELKDEQADNLKAAAEYTCKAYLEYFCIDTGVAAIEREYKKWTDDENINADSRLKLAETFAVMDKPAKALDQILRAWKRRDDVIRKVTTGYTEARTKKELLLASRVTFRLGQFKEALAYIDSIIEQWPDSPEGKLAYSEKIKILNELDMFEDLKDFLQKQSKNIEKDINYYTMLGRCCWELKEYGSSAKAWMQAFKMNRENGVYAANAANALEAKGDCEKALGFYIEAGRLFLKQDNNAELEILMPKLSLLGGGNWEARVLAGKWYFSIEDYDRCHNEFSKAEKLRKDLRPRPAADPALFYLWGLVYFIKGKNKEAISLLEKAVKLAPGYELFKNKLEEIKAADRNAAGIGAVMQLRNSGAARSGATSSGKK